MVEGLKFFEEHQVAKKKTVMVLKELLRGEGSLSTNSHHTDDLSALFNCLLYSLLVSHSQQHINVAIQMRTRDMVLTAGDSSRFWSSVSKEMIRNVIQYCLWGVLMLTPLVV